MKEIIKHKYSYLLFFLLLVSCFASAYGQERTITLNLSKVPLNTALKEIEKQTSMSVVYNTNDVDINRVISIKVTKESLNNVMNQLFRGVNVSFSIVDNHIVLSAKSNKEDQQKKTPITVSGTVTDSKGEPLIGVSILVKGTSNGTITGEVIQQVRVPIADTDNVGVVHDKLMVLGGRLVVETVDAILNDEVKAIPQDEMAVVGELRSAPKIFKETCRIDWNQPVKRIYDFIRGLSPYPAAWCELTDATGEAVAVKVFETEKIQETHQLVPGTIVTDGKNYLKIAATDGFVGILTLQLPGKKRLRTDELLRGYKIDKTALMR